MIAKLLVFLLCLTLYDFGCLCFHCTRTSWATTRVTMRISTISACMASWPLCLACILACSILWKNTNLIQQLASLIRLWCLKQSINKTCELMRKSCSKINSTSSSTNILLYRLVILLIWVSRWMSIMSNIFFIFFFLKCRRHPKKEGWVI